VSNASSTEKTHSAAALINVSALTMFNHIDAILARSFDREENR
jgi:hypothetical protein